MENKYYTPDKEDIRIGYQYEIYREIDDTWWDSKKTFSSTTSIDWIVNKLKENKLRVPYLTREDIESASWSRYENGKYDDKNYKYPEIGLLYTKGDIFLSWYPNLKEIEIHNNKCYSDRETWFDGMCKSINDLVYICKLLKIE